MAAKSGDIITVGQGDFTVAGILQTENGFEDGGVFLPLKTAQIFFSCGGISSIIAITLRDEAQGAAFQAAVAAAYPKLLALENREFNQSYTQFKILHLTAWTVGLCAFLLGGLGVANTIRRTGFSRIREIAVLRVWGFSQAQVAALIVTEAIMIAVLGLVVGLLLGYGALVAFERIPQFQGYVQAIVKPGMIVGLVFTALFTAVVGAIYPAFYASCIQPAEAWRYE